MLYLLINQFILRKSNNSGDEGSGVSGGCNGVMVVLVKVALVIMILKVPMGMMIVEVALEVK